MLSNSEIGLRIRSAREMRGLTLDDIATSVGVARSTVQRYEKGSIAKIKLPVLQSIAGALNVNPNWLIGNTDDPTSAIPQYSAASTLTAAEQQLVNDYRSLNEEGQDKVSEYAADLVASGRYQKELSASAG